MEKKKKIKTTQEKYFSPSQLLFPFFILKTQKSNNQTYNIFESA